MLLPPIVLPEGGLTVPAIKVSVSGFPEYRNTGPKLRMYTPVTTNTTISNSIQSNCWRHSEVLAFESIALTTRVSGGGTRAPRIGLKRNPAVHCTRRVRLRLLDSACHSCAPPNRQISDQRLMPPSLSLLHRNSLCIARLLSSHPIAISQNPLWLHHKASPC